MVHAHQVEETRHKKRNKDGKRATQYDGGTSKESLRSKISHDLRRVFPTKFLPMHQGKTKIR